MQQSRAHKLFTFFFNLKKVLAKMIKNPENGIGSEASESIKEHWTEMPQSQAHKLFTFFFNLKKVLAKNDKIS